MPIFLEDPGIYRPVILYSVPGKIVEHILLKSISKLVKDKEVIRNSQHRFIKGNSCLTNPMAEAFFRKIIGNVDKERAVILMSIDFNEVFDTVSHSIFTCKLRRCEQGKWAARNLSGLAAMASSHQLLNAWLADGDKQSILVVGPSTLGLTLFIVLRN